MSTPESSPVPVPEKETPLNTTPVDANALNATPVPMKTNATGNAPLGEEKEFPYNPNHAFGTCAKCGGEMIHNVPRLGAVGGFIHKDNFDWDCPTSGIPEANPESVEVSGQNQILDLLDLVDLRYNRSLADPYDPATCEAAMSDVPRLTGALRRALWAILVMRGEHWIRSDISPGIEIDQIRLILRGESEAGSVPLRRSSPASGVSSLKSPPPPALREERWRPQDIIDQCVKSQIHVDDASMLAESRNSTLSRLEQERDNWIESAAQFGRNSDFYQGIVRQIGEMFGFAAKTSDDGSIQEDVLALKVPELVQQLVSQAGSVEAGTQGEKQ